MSGSPWEVVGLSKSLSLDETSLEARYRELSKALHPDAGGNEADFSKLQEAKAILESPGRRLDAWLKTQGIETERTMVVTESVGQMYGRIDELTRGVDGWAAKPKMSGLGKALWQKEGLEWKSRLEESIDELTAWENRLGEELSELDKANGDGVNERVVELRAEFGFLTKWQAGLRERFGKIWEALV